MTCLRTDLVLPETFAPPVAARSPRSPCGRPLVYLAEDDLDLRAVMGAMLRQEGFDVFAAADGADVLSLLSAASRGDVRSPDALVLDVRMPRHGGDEILGALRRTGWTQPIVLMTGFASATTRARAHEEGASAIVDKPIDSRALADLLLQLMTTEDSHRDHAGADADRAPDTLRSPV